VARSTEEVVEAALAKALEGATAAGRWDVVAQLAKELEARRLAREPNVLALDPARSRRVLLGPWWVVARSPSGTRV
jgi:hypothetical protein